MASSADRMNSEDHRESADRADTMDNFTEREATLRREKARAKYNLTRAQNKLAALLGEQEIHSRRVIQDACNSMDACMDIAMEVISSLSELYMTFREFEKGKKVLAELDKLECEYAAASEPAREYLHARQDDRSSVMSDILTIDMAQRLNISDDSGTYQKQLMHEVNGQNLNIHIPETMPFPSGKVLQSQDTGEQQSVGLSTDGNHKRNMYDEQPENSDTKRIEPGTCMKARQMTPADQTETIGNGSVLSPNATTFQPSENRTTSTIGQDLWRQLKRVEIPTFSGDKRNYQNWKAAFIACIDNAPATGEYKLLQLRQYLSGEALKVIENLGHSSTAYEAAKERLERKFGGRRRQIAIYLEELEQFRQIRPGSARDLDKFADLLDIAIINLREADQTHELGVGSLYTKLQRKLPEAMLARYHRWIFENCKEESVLTLRTWVIQEAEFQTIASETVHGLAGRVAAETVAPTGARSRHQRTFFGNTKGNADVKKLICKICGGSHGAWNCTEFVHLSLPDRWNTAKELQLCFRCLGENHIGRSCPRSRPCGKNGCRELHHKLLHNSDPTDRIAAAADITSVKDIESSRETAYLSEEAEPLSSATEGNVRCEETTMVAQGRFRTDYVGLRTVPVTVKNGDRRLTVNALLDDASTKTYINADVAAELDLKGKTEQVTVNVLNGQVETFETKPVKFELESLDGNVRMNVSAFTANRVTGTMTVVDWYKYKKQWPHLKSIDFQRCATKPIVDILIGQDCPSLHYALKEVRGNPGEPVARLTPLGWTCIGNPRASDRAVLQTNFACTFFSKDVSEIEKLNENLKKFWEIESTATSEEGPIVRPEDNRALSSVRQSISYGDQMYRVGIPWKTKDPVLPDSYKMALQRLYNTEKRLKKIPEVSRAYSDCIQKYVEKGYVAKVPDVEHSNSKWFLPHFPVLRPDKETTKTRIVFDAAANVDGTSLNDQIYQGPKLQRELFDVLLRFRRYPIAVVCDIEEMYLRIGITESDKPYHRFLWRDMDQSRKPDIYEFDRVVFGVNSSPFQAQFVLQQHAKQYQSTFPMAAETVLKSTYMDDSMDSVETEDQGMTLYTELSTLLTKAGMHARKWLSNSSKVLKGIPPQDRKSEVDLDNDQLPSTKTLGVWWLADQDIFTFKENKPDDDMIYTKRNFLKKIATLFDPLGLLSPFTVRAKMLLQDMWTTGLDWDEEMPESLVQSARGWFSELCDLKKLQITRCLQEKEKIVDTLSLHTFVDSSESAYGAVVYARYDYQDGSISANIIAAKTKIAPSLAMSIPRLELMGAVVGVRLAKRVETVIDVPIRRATFWSDSVNVLWWIRGRSRQFKPFVANRVGEIQSNTEPEQWRYVPTSMNPADILSRGMKTEELILCSKWWKGPDFLSQSEEEWPLRKVVDRPADNMEMKTVKKPEFQTVENSSCSVGVTFVATVEPTDKFTVDPHRYLSWLRLKRVAAWVNRFTHNCQKSREDRIIGELQPHELKMAEVQLIKEAQRAEFTEEWSALLKGKSLSQRSKLLGMKPMLDENGLMRSDGRLAHAKYLSFDVRYPVILPRKSWVTKLIIKETHEQGKHACGTNHTLATLSAHYWIVSGREAIREW